MNIFATDKCPKKSAQNLDSKRVNKMLVESCQLLCTAINLSGGQAPYKSTHANHPCSIWTRASKSNFNWLIDHAQELSQIYTNETGKIHKCQLTLDLIQEIPVKLPELPLLPFANCAANKSLGLDFKSIRHPVNAYKQYLIERWKTDKRQPIWKNRQKPQFLKNFE